MSLSGLGLEWPEYLESHGMSFHVFRNLKSLVGMQSHNKEATKCAEEAMGLVENAVILGELRAAYENPIRERLHKVRMAVHEVHTSALAQMLAGPGPRPRESQ